jgi:predicted DNA-binding antitoxin AbrB/MazE fold protein
MEFKCNDVVAFSSGRFRLTPDQARPRAHVLKEVEKGVFEPTAEIQFKRGERVQILTPLPKRMASRLEPTKEGAEVAVAGDTEDTRRRRRA